MTFHYLLSPIYHPSAKLAPIAPAMAANAQPPLGAFSPAAPPADSPIGDVACGADEGVLVLVTVVNGVIVKAPPILDVEVGVSVGEGIDVDAEGIPIVMLNALVAASREDGCA